MSDITPLKPYQFKKGVSGNPAGRKTAGATLNEWYTIIAGRNLTEPELRRVAKNPQGTWGERTAALQLLRAMSDPDPADFESVGNGEKTLVQLRQDGVDTTAIKRIKSKTRTIQREGQDPEVIVENEIELHDRVGDAVDRVTDRTAGRARQVIEMVGEQSYRAIEVIVPGMVTATTVRPALPEGKETVDECDATAKDECREHGPVEHAAEDADGGANQGAGGGVVEEGAGGGSQGDAGSGRVEHPST